jgi:hypothetical protein
MVHRCFKVGRWLSTLFCEPSAISGSVHDTSTHDCIWLHAEHFFNVPLHSFGSLALRPGYQDYDFWSEEAAKNPACPAKNSFDPDISAAWQIRMVSAPNSQNKRDGASPHYAHRAPNIRVFLPCYDLGGVGLIEQVRHGYGEYASIGRTGAGRTER